jgi:hypothetical protein
MKPKYRSGEIVAYTILLYRQNKQLTPTNLYAALRIKFPGITDYAVREAFKDARLLIAIKQITNLDGDLS